MCNELVNFEQSFPIQNRRKVREIFRRMGEKKRKNYENCTRNSNSMTFRNMSCARKESGRENNYQMNGNGMVDRIHVCSVAAIKCSSIMENGRNLRVLLT